jgi:hypothetical protein
MKSALTVLASVILSLERAPEQATVLVLPGPGGTCVPRVARPVTKVHMDDTIE